MNTTEGKAQANAQDAALTGAKRVDVISYYQGALMGRFGPISQAGQDSIKDSLRAMGAFF